MEFGNKAAKKEHLQGEGARSRAFGNENVCPHKKELAKLDSNMCKLLRALMKGSVVEDKPGHHKKTLSNRQVFTHWRILPCRAELAVRRVAALRSAVLRPWAHQQWIATLFGDMECGAVPTINEEGALSEGANPHAKAVAEDLNLYRLVSCTEDFFQERDASKCSWIELFTSASMKNMFQWFDPKILRSAFWQVGSSNMWEQVMELTLEGDVEKHDRVFTCDISKCGLSFTSRRSLIAHMVKSKSSGHGMFSPLCRGTVTNQCMNCGIMLATRGWGDTARAQCLDEGSM